MKLTDGEKPPKSNASNNPCEPNPVPTNGSKYLTMAGGTVCSTRLISIELEFESVMPNERSTASRMLYVCLPFCKSIDAVCHRTFPPESASVPYAFERRVMYCNDVPTT